MKIRICDCCNKKFNNSVNIIKIKYNKFYNDYFVTKYEHEICFDCAEKYNLKELLDKLS